MRYLDTGCSNRMSGDKYVFLELDESFRNSVKFGNNSTISVMGKGNVTSRTKENSTQVIPNVFFVLDFKKKLLSIGQLQEKRYKIVIKE